MDEEKAALLLYLKRKDGSAGERLKVKTDLDKQNLIQKFEKELEAHSVDVSNEQ